MILTSEEIEWYRKAKETVRKGYFPDGNRAVEDYKRIFAEEIKQGKMRGNLNPHCGSCIKEAVLKVNEAINNLEKLTENDGQGTEKKN